MSEAECFETFLRELAYFYTPTPPIPLGPDVDEKEQYKAERWQIQHILTSGLTKPRLGDPISFLVGAVA